MHVHDATARPADPDLRPTALGHYLPVRSGRGERHTARADIQRGQAVELFERRRDAWLAEDIDGYLACFADEIVMETPMGQAVCGIEAYGELVRRSLKAMRPLSFEFHALAVDGDRVLAEWTIALQRRDNGDVLTYRGMSVGELADGRIRTWREYYDPAFIRGSRSS